MIADLADIVSKNGCLLLNIGPKKDGTIPEDQAKTLLDMGEWLEVNGEAIYGASYWKTYGEGPTKINLGHLSESKNKKFTQADIRFTTNNGNLYAITLVPPTKDIRIKTLNSNATKIESVELLGYDGKLDFKQTKKELIIKYPKDTELSTSWVFKVKEQG